MVCQHWRYFFPANVASLLSASGSPALDAEVEHRAELVAIMNAYGCCLLQNGDLETFGLVSGSGNISQLILSSLGGIAAQGMSRRNGRLKIFLPQVLRSLGELQRKWKLFQRPIFRVSGGENDCGLLGQFIGVLLRCLLQRSHDLLREEMLHLVFAMASTMPFDVFHQVLRSFLEPL